jgi:hypothetical protein
MKPKRSIFANFGQLISSLANANRTRCSAWLKLNYGDRFDFAAIFSDKFKNFFSQGTQRRCRSSDLINGKKGIINPSTMFSVLRDHGDAGVS